MKDATGELSMTAVAVIAIAAISVVFSQFIWPTIKATLNRNVHCAQSFDCQVQNTDKGNVMYRCNYCEDEKCDNIGEVMCSANQVGSGGSTTAE